MTPGVPDVLRVGDERSELRIELDRLVAGEAGEVRLYASLTRCKAGVYDRGSLVGWKDLAAPVQVIVRLDGHSLRAMACKAATSSGQKAKRGPVTVRVAKPGWRA